MTLLPPLFLKNMRQSLGGEFPAFEAAMKNTSPVSIRLHPSKAVGLFEKMEPVPWHPDGRYLPERPVFTLDPLFHTGAYYVQEASSMLIFQALRQYMDFSKKITALDLCASPGGKSTLLASALSNDSLLVANEVIKNRIPALKMNLTKWGQANVLVANHDPGDFRGLENFFDLALVDAPCSGEGLFRKDEKAASEWSPENVALCAARQRRILQAAEPLVRPGGLLIYSTCTFNEKEDEANVRWILEKGNFEYLSLQTEPGWGILGNEYGYHCYPHRVKGEGFFMAVFRKKGVPENGSKRKKREWKNLKRLGKKQLPLFAEWLAGPGRFEFFEKPKGGIVAVPKAVMPEVERVGDALNRRGFGVEIGQLKKQHFIPSHALALSLDIHPDLPSVELEKGQALHFLRKDNFELSAAPKGWALMKYKGVNLGWAKVLPGRVNNYLPMEWRIRMALP